MLKTSLKLLVAKILNFSFCMSTGRSTTFSLEEWKTLRFSFSQFGEDLSVIDQLSMKDKGFFVDIGAFDPVGFSNTNLLSHRGYRGINVDPNHERIAKFERLRPNDINLCLAISDGDAEMDYYSFPSPALNQITPTGQAPKPNVLNETPIGVRSLRVCSLASILDQYLPANTEIDFLNIDCEEHDLAVLNGNDWNRFSPIIIAVEATQNKEKEVISFCLQKGYRLLAIHNITYVFVRNKQ
jgi:FkbM family methyltransferase